MDIKVDGLPYPVLEKALMQAREGRLHILDKVEETMTEAREDYKPNVPRIEQIEIPKDCIGAVIGPGGKVIQEMQAETDTTITIEEVGDQGVVQIYAQNKEGLNDALGRIKNIVAKPEIGEVYDGKVKSITNFGAFVEFMPGKEALLHISEIDWKRLEKVEDALKEGDSVKVKLIGLDKKTGKLKLSRKVLMERPPRQDKPKFNKERRDFKDRKNDTKKEEA
jgi:polyribonucleotide nucleotidyltransferase